MLISILTPSELSVNPRRHPRVLHPDIPAPALDPALRAFGRHIAKCHRKQRRVHIPAMTGGELGQVLRTLELKRAFN